ncbi:MAG: hypothetical protein AAFX50_12010, partial [Acidobacteriota bacterium]
AKWGRGQRGVPDVAALASLTAGYSLVVGDARVGIGGTSAAAPLVAGLVSQIVEANAALAPGYRVGWLTPLLYRPEMASAFAAIDRGSNGLYNAYSSWDPCTGLGRPHGRSLMRALAAEAAAAGSDAGPKSASSTAEADPKETPAADAGAGGEAS